MAEGCTGGTAKTAHLRREADDAASVGDRDSQGLDSAEALTDDGDTLPDFAQFLDQRVEENDVEAASQVAADQRDLAAAAEALFRAASTGAAAVATAATAGAAFGGIPTATSAHLPPNDRRRLLIEVPIPSAGRVVTPQASGDSAGPARSGSIADADSGVRSRFFARLLPRSKRATQGKPENHLAEFSSVAEFVASQATRTTSQPAPMQAYLFDDVFALAARDSRRHGLVLVLALPLMHLSLRAVGDPWFIDDEQFCAGAEEEKESPEKESANAPSAHPLSESTSSLQDSSCDGQSDADQSWHRSCRAILELSTDEEVVLVDFGEAATKSDWANRIIAAVEKRVRSEDPMRIVNDAGWKHSIHRGTLWAAAKEGDMGQVGAILRAIEQAAHEGRELHLGHGPGFAVDINQADSDGLTALHLAAQSGRAIVVKQLLAATPPADHFALDNELRSPLHFAAMSLSAPAAIALIEAGAELDTQDLKDRTPLMLAIWTTLGCMERDPAGSQSAASSVDRAKALVKGLASAGADLEAKDVSGLNPLQACTLARNVDLVSVLIACGANLETRRSGCTPLALIAAAEPPGLAQIAQRLLQAGANPNARDDFGRTPLHILANTAVEAGAVDDEQRELANLLVAFGAQLECSSDNGESAGEATKRAGFDLASALGQWKSREEPRAAVSFLASKCIYRIPFAAGPTSPCWQPDSSSTSCLSCGSSFSLLARRHHCRRCGRLFCATCCSKQVTLRPAPSASDGAANGRPEPVKVCVSCFNCLSHMLARTAGELGIDAEVAWSESGASSASPPLAPAAQSEEQARQSLFGASKARSDNSDRTSREPPGSRGFAGASEALRQAKDKLIERGEQLRNIADSAEAMSNNAANFSTFAKKLREREERKTGFFGSLF